MTRLVKKERRSSVTKGNQKEQGGGGLFSKVSAHSTDSEEATRKNFNLFI